MTRGGWWDQIDFRTATLYVRTFKASGRRPREMGPSYGNGTGGPISIGFCAAFCAAFFIVIRSQARCRARSRRHARARYVPAARPSICLIRGNGAASRNQALAASRLRCRSSAAVEVLLAANAFTGANRLHHSKEPIFMRVRDCVMPFASNCLIYVAWAVSAEAMEKAHSMRPHSSNCPKNNHSWNSSGTTLLAHCPSGGAFSTPPLLVLSPLLLTNIVKVVSPEPPYPRTAMAR